MLTPEQLDHLTNTITRNPAGFSRISHPEERVHNQGIRTAVNAILHAANEGERIEGTPLKKTIAALSNNPLLTEMSVNYYELRVTEDNNTGALLVFAYTHEQDKPHVPILFLDGRSPQRINTARLKPGGSWTLDPNQYYFSSITCASSISTRDLIEKFLNLIYSGSDNNTLTSICREDPQNTLEELEKHLPQLN